MASAIRKLTGVGGDVRKIARLLQKKAPPGHMLAYINQEEADLLKARGGSGKPHADTGVPSFDAWWNVPDTSGGYGSSVEEPVNFANVETPSSVSYPSQYPSSPPVSEPTVSRPAYESYNIPENVYREQYSKYNQPSIPSPLRTRDDLGVTGSQTAAEVQRLIDKPVPPPGITPGVSDDSSLFGDVKNWWNTLQPDTKAKLGIGGVESVLAAYQTSQALEQARKYREDLANVAKPYQQEGKKLIAQAQSGQLTPAAQQQLQAAQAQAAQGAQARGGVGAQQAMMAVENMRQQLLQNQYDYGLKVSGIGDQIAVGAIKAGMQADQYVNSMASSYANNIARILAGTPTAPTKE